MKIAWMLLGCLLGGVGAAAQERPPEKALELPAGVTMKRDVVFAEGLKGPLQADFYLPAKAGLRPAIVFVHGGGWTSGVRSQMAKASAVLAGDGFVGMQIDYDLSGVGGEAHFPLALEECKEAVRWLRAHAAEYGVDPGRIAVAGSSAGGELAALMALSNGEKRYDGRGENRAVSSDVRAAVVYNGVLDLTALGDESAMVTAYLGGVCSGMAKACAEASPTRQVHAGVAAIYVGHGTVDQTVPFAQFTAFVAALKAAKVPVTEFVAEDGKHTYWADSRFFAKNVEATEGFLRGVMGKE